MATTSVLVFGDNTASHLLKVALAFAETGCRVWFLTPEPFKTIPPGITLPDRDILKLLTFIYLHDIFDLLQHLNEIHSWRQVPQLLILHELTHYVNDIQSGCYLVSNLLDAIKYCANQITSNVILIASCLSSHLKENGNMQPLVNLYFDHCLHVSLIRELNIIIDFL